MPTLREVLDLRPCVSRTVAAAVARGWGGRPDDPDRGSLAPAYLQAVLGDREIPWVEVLDIVGLHDSIWLIGRLSAWLGSRLRLFAADCAERALLREREAGREPDDRSWEALRVSRAYARGDAGAVALLDAYQSAVAAAAADLGGGYPSLAAERAATPGCGAVFSAAVADTLYAATEAAGCAAHGDLRDGAAVADEIAWQAARLREMLEEEA